MRSEQTDDLVRGWQFDELVREGVSLIPAYAPSWTNHNVSDPGITLVELFAYFTEILAYRALRITPDAKLNFLALLDGEAARADREALHGRPSDEVDAAIRARVRALSHAQCAVTPLDFERLASEAANRGSVAGVAVRARAMPGVDLRHDQGGIGAAARPEAAGDVSVVLAPERDLEEDVLERLCAEVERALAPRCLLTTRVHVVGPAYLHISVGGRVALEPGASLESVHSAIDEALRRRFGPARRDEPVVDRPFGRSLHLSEIAEVIDRVEGVDWVEDVSVLAIGERGVAEHEDEAIGLRIGVVATVAVDSRLGGKVSIAERRFVRDSGGEVAAVCLRPWELVRVRLAGKGLVRIGDAGVEGDIPLASGGSS